MPYTPWPINHNSTNSNFQPRPNSHISLLPTLNIPRLLQSTPSKLAINRIFDEKRVKGICFWCDEKFVSGHKYRRKQAFVIQLHVETKGNEEGEVISEVVEHNSTIEEHVLMQLSFQTLYGSIGARTMRLGGMHRRKRLYILIDS